MSCLHCLVETKQLWATFRAFSPHLFLVGWLVTSNSNPQFCSTRIQKIKHAHPLAILKYWSKNFSSSRPWRTRVSRSHRLQLLFLSRGHSNSTIWEVCISLKPSTDRTPCFYACTLQGNTILRKFLSRPNQRDERVHMNDSVSVSRVTNHRDLKTLVFELHFQTPSK